MPRLLLVNNPFHPELLERNIEAGKTIREVFLGKELAGAELNGEPVTNFDYVLAEDDELAAYINLEADWLVYIYYAIVAITFAAAVYQLLNGPPETPEEEERSPTYNLSGQSNQARPGAPIPYRFGEDRIYPDVVALPYSEYFGSDQYLYQVFGIGMGEYAVNDIRIEDTPITNFEGVTTQVVYNDRITLFPSNVVTSVEVANQELAFPGWIGPFIINPTGTDINRIVIDVVMPQGIGRQRSSGAFESITLFGIVEIEHQEVDDSGTPIGSWVFNSATLSGSHREPFYRSIPINVADGRYQVRVRRASAENTGHKIFDDIHWLAARGFISEPTVYTDMTVLAVRMRASDQLNGASRRRINLKYQRKIPGYSGGSPTVNTATRSPAWAIAAAAQDRWAGNQPLSTLDISEIEAAHTLWASKGYYFDGSFDRKETMLSVLNTIAAAAKAFVLPSLNKLSVKTEAAQALPAHVFSRANMRNETVGYEFEKDEDYDSVEVLFKDRDLDYSETSIHYAITAAGTTDNPKKFDMRRGSTDRAHIWKLAKFLGNKIRYQRQRLSFDTELEGYLAEKGDKIVVPTDTVGDLAIAGEVLEVSGGSNQILTLSHAVYTELAVDHAVMLRDRNGDVYGPYTATINAGTDGFVITLNDLPAINASPVAGLPNILYVWGEELYSFEEFVVTEVKPKQGYDVTIEAVNYDARVYDETGSAPAPRIRPLLPVISERPSILYVRIENSADPTVATVAVVAEPGWTHFVYQYSFDNVDWSAEQSSALPNFEIQVFEEGLLYVRIAAVGESRGDWFTVSQVLGADGTAAGFPQLSNLVSDLVSDLYTYEDSVAFSWDVDTDALQYFWQAKNSNGDTILSGYVETNSLTLSRTQIMQVVAGVGRGAADLLLTFSVTSASHTGAVGPSPASIDITNVIPAAPSSVIITEGFNALLVTTTATLPADIAGMVIHRDVTNGFTPNESNRIYKGDFNQVLAIPSSYPLGTTVYFRVGLYDVFGDSVINYYSQVAIVITKNVEIDHIVPQQFGSSLVQNSYLDQSVPRSNGTLRPAGWQLDGYAYSDLTYLDASRDKVVLDPSGAHARMISNAFAPNLHDTYRLRIRMRVRSGTHTVRYGVAEKLTGLADGRYAVRPATPGTVVDSGIDSANASSLSFTDQSVGTTWTEYTHDYTPSLGTDYASLYVEANGTEIVEIDYFYVYAVTEFATTAQQVFYQATAPNGEGEALNDLWIRDSDNKLHRYNGTTWLEVQDDDIAQALLDAAGAQGTADNKVYIFAQASQPVNGDHPEGALEVGDLWFHTGNNNRLHRWNGSSWVEHAQTEANWSLVIDDDGNRPENGATRNTVTSGTAVPTGGANGDLYRRTSTSEWYAKIAGVWVIVGDVTAQHIAAGIVGQGGLATLDDVVLSQHVRDTAGNFIIESSITNFDDASALGFNGALTDWTSDVPDGWTEQGSRGSRNESIVLTGSYSARFLANGTQAWFSRDSSVQTPVVNMTIPGDAVLIGSVDMYVASGFSGTPGIGASLIQANSPYKYYRQIVPANTSIVNRWQRLYFKVHYGGTDVEAIGSPVDGTDFIGVQVAFFAGYNYAGSGKGALTQGTGTVYYDNVRFMIVDPTVANERQLYADVTGGPPADATRNSVTSGSGLPSGGVNGDLYYRTSNQAWYARISGVWTQVGDNTAVNIASGIVNQGGLATQDVVDWLTDVTGDERPEDYAGVNNPDLGGLIYNSAFRIRDVERDRPVGWYLAATTVSSAVQYQDAGKTIAYLRRDQGDTSVDLCSTAMQVNPNVIYQLRVRIRADGSAPTGALAYIVEYDGDLPNNALYISRSTQAPTWDAQFLQYRTRQILSITSMPLTTSWATFTAEYQPTASARWASVIIINNGAAHNFQIGSVTLDINPAALAAQDTVGQNDIDKNAVVLTDFVSYTGNITIADPGTSPPMGTWVTAGTLNITLPATVTDTTVLLDFTASIEANLYGQGSTIVSGWVDIDVRFLDDDNVVHGQDSFKLYAAKTTALSNSNCYGARQVANSILLESANLNAGQVNTFRVQIAASAGSTAQGIVTMANRFFRAAVIHNSEI